MFANCCRGFLVLAGLLLSSVARGESPSLELPPGFESTLFAGDDLASNIQCMTVNAAGEIVVSGPGYIRLLSDTDGDGVADTVRLLADGPKTGGQGLCVDGNNYYCIGDGGLLKYTDQDGDGQADGPPELVLPLRTGGEHLTHAIRRGPDGYWYIIAGNEAGISTSFINSVRSPITKPHAGVLLRFSPDFQTTEVLADGYRNAYDFDFTAEGDLFTYDSDGEREISLPIYRPTRVFHTVPGMNHGWVSRSWKKPNYFAEMSPTVFELGRGSPTGVVVYRHDHFPPEFQNSLFVLDWTYGRVVGLKLNRQGASWQAQAKNFATAKGDYGFAPTDAAVGADGALYISVGGRGTQGAVFRIHYPGRAAAPGKTAMQDSLPRPSGKPKVDTVLKAPQPLSAWSRSVWVPAARKLGEEAFLVAVSDPTRPVRERIRGLEILVELFQGPDFDLMETLAVDPDRELRARAIWAYGRSAPHLPDAEILNTALNDTSPVVVRAALEYLDGCTEVELLGFEAGVARCFGNEDHVVRQLAVQVASRMSNDGFREIGEVSRKSGWAEAMQMARSFVDRGYIGHTYAWHDIGLAALSRQEDPNGLLTALLLIQHSLGGFGDSPIHPEMFDGYLARLPLPDDLAKRQAVVAAIAARYPYGHPLVDWEAARLIAMLNADSPEVLEKLLAHITAESTAVEDIHHLCCIACLPTPRTSAQTERIAESLLAISQKLEAAGAPIDRNWEPRMSELVSRLLTLDASLAATLAARPEFGRPEHILFVKTFTGEARLNANDKLLGLLQTGKLPLTPEILSLFSGAINTAVLELARDGLGDDVLKPAALVLLAEANLPEDRAVLTAGLAADQWDVVSACLKAASAWEQTGPEILAAQVRLLQRLKREPELTQLWDDTLVQVERHANLLSKNADLAPATGPQFDPLKKPTREQIALGWRDWVDLNFPEFSVSRAAESDRDNQQSWESLLTTVNWDAGDSRRGVEVFQRQQCAQCHQGRSTVGPSLDGITRRFSTRDLLISIVDPHRDVSPRYRTTLLVTTAGKTYTGIIIYESVDGLLLRDTTHRTVRIAAEDIEIRKQLTSSLMPENLLKDVSSEQIADLFAYLRSLGEPDSLTKQD